MIGREQRFKFHIDRRNVDLGPLVLQLGLGEFFAAQFNFLAAHLFCTSQRLLCELTVVRDSLKPICCYVAGGQSNERPERYLPGRDAGRLD